MKKYIYNSIELEISKDEESHDDSNNLNGINRCQSESKSLFNRT
jgi:hypothetical protein